jgi:hypothetical protein
MQKEWRSKMKPLTKGDPCRVRLHTGEVVEAVYDDTARYPKDHPKCHWVEFNNRQYFARQKIVHFNDCRFVGNPCDLVPVGVSV